MENKSSITKYFILSELSSKELHGYDIISRIGQITGKRPSASQIYPVLSQLRGSGYLTVKQHSDGKRKMKTYTLTAKGRKLFASMQVRFEALIMTALREKIKVCRHCSCQILSGAVSKKISGKNAYFCCMSCEKSYRSSI